MNANNPMTPGVYTVEKNAFPDAVAQVPTAIPAFIGYTEKATKDGKPLTEPLLINSMVEFHDHFGGAPVFKFPINAVDVPPPSSPGGGKVIPPYDFEINDKYYSVGPPAPGQSFYLYHCLQLFYQNGGGPCYIVSIGPFTHVVEDATTGAVTTPPVVPDKDHFLDGLALLPRIPFPKPTMILTPDALHLEQADYYTVQQQCLQQCGELKDRVAIIDVWHGDKSDVDAGVIKDFRNKIGNNYMNYGISYYPFLETTIVGAADATFANVDETSADAVNLAVIFPGETSLGQNGALRSIREDYNKSLKLAATPQLNFGNPLKPPPIPDKGTEGIPYSSWSTAYSAFPSGGAIEDPLKWQAKVIYAMASVLFTLQTTGKVVQLGVEINTADLKDRLKAMMSSKGYLASVLTKLVTYDTNFPGGGLGTFTDATVKALFPDANSAPTTNPYKFKDPANGTVGEAFGPASGALEKAFGVMRNAFAQVSNMAMSFLDQYNTALEGSNPNYKSLMGGIAKAASVLPPGPAMAGVMTLVDNSEGVWISPANRNINSVVAPSVPINNDEQASLNVDALAGKSINAIRAFYGRGPAIIWGARTLDGNSLDWRYVSIRRTMIMLEQSVENAAFDFVFDSNNASTWGLCESMISNFLHNLWAAGALQGASPADAYSVSVGLGKTMTPLDILNGIMRVQVKVALVHPGEFIIITYDQQMAKS